MLINSVLLNLFMCLDLINLQLLQQRSGRCCLNRAVFRRLKKKKKKNEREIHFVNPRQTQDYFVLILLLLPHSFLFDSFLFALKFIVL